MSAYSRRFWMAKETEEFFDERSGKWSEHYQKRGYLSHFFRARMDEISKLIPRNNQGKLLDSGCGTGDSVQIAREKGYSFHGIDISQKMVDVCKKRFAGPGTSFQKANIEELGFGEGEFDVIISAGVLEYVNDDALASRELHRVLRRNGLLITTFPNRSSPLLRIEKFLGRFSPRARAFHREYTSGQARNILESAGFRILDEIHVSYLPVNIGLRIPFPTAVDSVLGTALRLLGLKSWGLTRIIKARK